METVLSGGSPVQTSVSRSAPQEALSDATYERWRSRLLPDERDDAWRKIAWRPTVWGAIAEASRNDKPLLVWLISGVALGHC